jgi:hypothetical protein
LDTGPTLRRAESGNIDGVMFRALRGEVEDAVNASNGSRGRRTTRDDPLVEAVGWRLFKTEEIPARMRRLRTMEETAERSPALAPKPPAAKAPISPDLR